jgi:alkylhydroperoxidase/carboxymuconolactone decarboxylase family protein YurZ
MPEFFKNTPQDVLTQMWPLMKKYELGDSLIPQKYREMIALATAAAMKCPTARAFIKKSLKCMVLL